MKLCLIAAGANIQPKHGNRSQNIDNAMHGSHATDVHEPPKAKKQRTFENSIESLPKYIPKSYNRNIKIRTEYSLNDNDDDNESNNICSSIGKNVSFNTVPNDCEAALTYLAKLFPQMYFNGRLPTIILSTQLHSILERSSISTIEFQLKTLIYMNKIIIFPTFSSQATTIGKTVSRSSNRNSTNTKPSTSSLSSNSCNSYLIVFFDEFVNLKKHHDDKLFHEFVTQILPYERNEKESSKIVPAEEVSSCNNTSSSDLSTHEIIRDVSLVRLISKVNLLKRLKLESENDVRRLVNGGYLGIQEHGLYCLSLPGAGEFIKVWEKGRKVVLGNIRRAKFGEILQQVRFKKFCIIIIK